MFIVTGASSGIGLATAKALSGRGANVALLARSTGALEKLAEQLPGSLAATVDMTQRALLGFSLTARAELGKDGIVVSEVYPFITATNFGANRMGNPAGGGPPSNYAAGDTPEFVAGLVLQAIEEGQAQYFANDRLRKMAGVAP